MAPGNGRARARTGRIIVATASLAAAAAVASGSAVADVSSFEGEGAGPDAARAAGAFAKLLPRATEHSTGDRHRRQIVSPSLTSAGDHLSALGALGAPTIAKDPARGYILDTGRGPLQIAPAWNAPSAPAPALANDAAAVFPNMAVAVDVLMRPTAAGISTLLRLDGQLAAESYSWSVATPIAHELRLLDDGGVAVVAAATPGPGDSGAAAPQAAGVDERGANDSGDQAADADAANRSAESELGNADVLAVVAPPRAHDAKGRPLTTRLEVHGDVITLNVAHRRATTRYGALAQLDVSTPDALTRPWVDAPATGPVQRGPDGLLKVLLSNGEVLLTHGPDPLPPGSDEGENPLGDGALGRASLDAGPPDPDPDEEDDAPVASAGTGPPYLCGGRNQRRILALHAGDGTTTPATRDRIRSVMIGMNNKLYDESVESGGRKNPARFRFECQGDGQIEVRSYVPNGPDFDGVVIGAKDAGFRDPDINYVIFTEVDQDGLCGEGNQYPDDRPGKRNLANDGSANATYEGETPAEGTYAIAYGRRCWQVDIAMHENAHTMGAVSDNSPGSSGRGHCDDGYDVMCYDDREEEDDAFTYHADVCELGRRGMKFDCEYNTYFDTKTESGEWLSRHWNLGHENNLALSFAATKPTPENFLALGTNLRREHVRGLVSGTYADGRMLRPRNFVVGNDWNNISLSPDGRSILYDEEGCGILVWARLDGSERRELWDCGADGSAVNAAFAGSNAKIVFECGSIANNGGWEVCGMDIESGARHVIADFPNSAVLHDPAEAGHRRLVAFVSNTTPQGVEFGEDNGVRREHIFLTKRDGTNPVQFTHSDRFLAAYNPQFSPDSNWISFEALDPGQVFPYFRSVWVARVDGTGLRRISEPGAGYTTSAGWTPEGRVTYIQLPFDTDNPPFDSNVMEADVDDPDGRRVMFTGQIDALVFRQSAYWQLGFNTPVPQPIP